MDKAHRDHYEKLFHKEKGPLAWPEDDVIATTLPRTRRTAAKPEVGFRKKFRFILTFHQVIKSQSYVSYVQKYLTQDWRVIDLTAKSRIAKEKVSEKTNKLEDKTFAFEDDGSGKTTDFLDFAGFKIFADNSQVS